VAPASGATRDDMGATTWNYFVAYEADTEAALKRLREKVFKGGEYESGVVSPDQIRAAYEQVIGQDSNPNMARLQIDQVMEQLRPLMPPERPKAKSIEELIEQRAENGTHSILDIQQISDTSGFAAVGPMPSEELVKLFGTDKPTRTMVEDKLGDYDLVEHPLISERWQGIYFVVYRDGKPDELFFMGTSGD
jgi:hypothetical protein